MASFSYPDSCSYTPSDLAVFKIKVVEDMAALTDKEAVLGFLLDRSRAVETVVAGSLRRNLYDLYEALHWGFATEKAVKAHRTHLLAAAEDDLGKVKRTFFLHLAKERGVLAEYLHEIKKAENHTVSDYEALAELEYAFIVWRTDLKRDLSLTNDHEAKAALVRAAYIDAEALVKRCLHRSHCFWNEQQMKEQDAERQRRELSAMGGMPYSPPYSPGRASVSARRVSLSDTPLGGDSVIGVYERAMAQVWLRLEALAQQHGVMEQLQVFVSGGSTRGASPKPLQPRNGAQSNEQGQTGALSFGQVAEALKRMDGGAAPSDAAAAVSTVAEVGGNKAGGAGGMPGRAGSAARAPGASVTEE
ncbi:hypothetical protein WJX81_001696 [Elliptochloris bilobata]|uniref:Uncharacterized protein n=1 Tax=Elliptochloris bilobata TaxID=381761 RepID=A0AAW1S2Y3_9CHLO